MRRRNILLLVLIVSVVLGWWTYGDALDWESLAAREHQLRQAVDANWPSSLLFGFVVYVALSLVPGTTGKSIVYGWLFGFWMALLIVSTALTIAAVVSFLAVRYFFRDLAKAKLSRFIRIIDDAVLRNGATWLVSLRLLHAPYTVTNYASGASAVPLTTFAWTTQLGMLPGTIVFVLAGSSIRQLGATAEQGIWSVVDVQLLVLLSLLAFLPFFGRLVRRRFQKFRRVGQESPATRTHHSN